MGQKQLSSSKLVPETSADRHSVLPTDHSGSSGRTIHGLFSSPLILSG